MILTRETCPKAALPSRIRLAWGRSRASEATARPQSVLESDQQTCAGAHNGPACLMTIQAY